jgi:arylsulfatase A-like enzyme
MLPTICANATAFIDLQQSCKPFIAYVALPVPYTPISVVPEWQGKSPLGKYGDFAMQTGDVIGQIFAVMDAAGFGENSLIIVTSANGCSRSAKIPALQIKGNFLSAQYRGSKADL